MKNTKFTGILACLVALAVTATAGIEILRGITLRSPVRPAPEAAARAQEPAAGVRALLRVQETLTAGVLLYQTYVTSDDAPLSAQDTFRLIQESHKTDLLLVAAKIAERRAEPLRLFAEDRTPSHPPTDLQSMTLLALNLEDELSAVCRAALQAAHDRSTRAMIMAIDEDSAWASRTLRLMSRA